MDYRKHYIRLIETRKNRITDNSTYYERHHVIPKYMGGSNDSLNIVKLTAREHFLAHWLLWKIYNDRKSALAFSMMKRGKNRKLITSAREFSAIREALSKSQIGNGNHSFGKRISHEHAEKLKLIAHEMNTRIWNSLDKEGRSERAKLIWESRRKNGSNHMKPGRKVSEEGRKKMGETMKKRYAAFRLKNQITI